ncbi:DNA mismatch repair protein MutS [Circinella umbellata]|nr:DNA mismatch repair protein MutS [Circinella umbellata]
MHGSNSMQPLVRPSSSDTYPNKRHRTTGNNESSMKILTTNNTITTQASFPFLPLEHESSTSTSASTHSHDQPSRNDTTTRSIPSIIMALNWSKGNMGCVYYTHEFHELYMMNDISVEKSYTTNTLKETIQSLIEQVTPQIIIVPYNSEEWMDGFTDDNIQIQEISMKSFIYSHGRYKLVSWFIQQQHQHQQPSIYINSSLTKTSQDMNDNKTTMLTEEEEEEELAAVFCDDPHDGQKRQAFLQLACYIDLDSQISVGCSGALLDYLEQLEDTSNRPIGNRFNNNETSFRPLQLRSFSSEKCIQISKESQRALCIFEKDSHPSAHQKRGKESLSLFGLLNHTATPMGYHLLKSWVSRPSLDIHVIQTRQKAIDYFSTPNTIQFVKELYSQLKHIKNVARIISMIQEHRGSYNEWHQLLEFVYYTIRIHSSFVSERQESEVDIIQKILYTINPGILRTIGNEIDKVLDFNQSKMEGRIVVKNDYNIELDALRETYAGLDGTLLAVSQEMSRCMSPHVAPLCNVVYFPQLGYLITLPTYLEHSIDPQWGFEPQFTTAENLYFKDGKTRELDETLGDIHAMIIDKEIELVQELSDKLSVHFKDLLVIADVCAELDCLLSLAHAATRYEYIKPEMTLDNQLMIIQGRHPLQELSVDVFIPNDTYLVGGHAGDISTIKENNTNNDSMGTNTTGNSVALLTGANFSGKSVYLRQIGLITYMAHIGSFVPATRAIIGITDKIFTCIQTVETVSKLQSAFALDIQQLSQAIHYATEKSLVLIDEFGNGTESSDGAALLCSTLGYFLYKGDLCPKILAITHFHELISQQIINPETNPITFLTMEILNAEVSGESSETMNEVVFLYKVVDGSQACNSYGAWCASIAGVPTPIVRRALELSNVIYNGQTIRPVYNEEEENTFLTIERIAQKLLTVKNEDSNISDQEQPEEEKNGITAQSLVDELVQLISES